MRKYVKARWQNAMKCHDVSNGGAVIIHLQQLSQIVAWLVQLQWESSGSIPNAFDVGMEQPKLPIFHLEE